MPADGVLERGGKARVEVQFWGKEKAREPEREGFEEL